MIIQIKKPCEIATLEHNEITTKTKNKQKIIFFSSVVWVKYIVFKTWYTVYFSTVLSEPWISGFP